MDNFLAYENDKYNQGIELEEYNGIYSLVLARQGEDGTIFKNWVFPSRYDKDTKEHKAVSKSLPWKIKIGNSESEAIETLQYFIGLLGGQEYSGPPVDDDDGIPF